MVPLMLVNEIFLIWNREELQSPPVPKNVVHCEIEIGVFRRSLSVKLWRITFLMSTSTLISHNTKQLIVKTYIPILLHHHSEANRFFLRSRS